jgi:hypothetical protein
MPFNLQEYTFHPYMNMWSTISASILLSHICRLKPAEYIMSTFIQSEIIYHNSYNSCREVRNKEKGRAAERNGVPESGKDGP